MDEQEAENDLDKLDPILDGLYYEEYKKPNLL